MNDRVTLRDLRRIAAKPMRAVVLPDPVARALDLVEVSAGLRAPGQTRKLLAKRLADVAPVLDRMISRLGPDFVLSDRIEGSRPEAERTNHRTGSDAEISAGAHTNQDAATHGGDGNSGECDHHAQTAAAGREGENTDDLNQSSADACNSAAGDDSGQSRGTPEPGEGAQPQGCGTRTGDGTAPDAAASAGDGKQPAEPQGGEDGKPGSGDPGLSDSCARDAGENRQPAEMGAADAENPAHSDPDNDRTPNHAAAPDSAQGADMSDEAGNPEQEDVGQRQQSAEDGDIVRSLVHAAQQKRESRDATTSSQYNSRLANRYGGRQHDEDGSFALPFRLGIKTPDTARIAAALKRLSDIVGQNSTTATPRWDVRALTRELVSRRVALHRARQTAPQPRYVLVMPDMSGSCAHIARVTAAVAAGLAATDSRIIVAPTCTGGLPEGVIAAEAVYGKCAELVRQVMKQRRTDRLSDVHDWQALKAAGVTHILVMGDVHGHASYEAARDAGVKVIWCDPNAKTMPVKDTRGMAYVEISNMRSIAKAIERAISRMTK